MVISIKDVEYVLELARLELSEENKKKFTSQVDSILNYMDQLNKVSTENIEPTSHVIPVKNVFRDDEPKRFEDIDQIMKNAPLNEDNYFNVPRILE